MFNEPILTSSLAELLEAELAGSGDVTIKALASLAQAGDGDVAFAADKKRFGEISTSNASAFIVPADVKLDIDKPLLKVADVDMAIATLLAHIAPKEDSPQGIASSASIADDAKLGQNVHIGEFVSVGSGVVIGDGCVLFPGVKIGRDVVLGDNCVVCEGGVIRYGCVLGNNVRIGPNSVIGHDGYGYHFANGLHNKIIHAGNVVIEDDVEVGACACIDRAKWGSTLIGAGSKIDNLVQVAHNVQLGRGVLLVAQAGVAGSTKLGNYVVLGGGAGVKDNISIGDGTRLAAHSALAQAAGAGETLVGTPARDGRRFFREIMSLAKLPDLIRKVKKLEKAIAKLSKDK